MASVHVLSYDGGRYTVALHIAVPNTDNAAGVNWRTVMLRNGFGSTVLPDGDGTLGTISASEKADVTAGAVVEIVRQLKPIGAAPSAAVIDAAVAQAKQQELDAIQARFNRYGLVRA